MLFIIESKTQLAKQDVSLKATRTRPVLLDVNRESRFDALKVYHLCFDYSFLKQPSYFSHDLDLLVFKSEESIRLFGQANLNTGQWSSPPVRFLGLRFTKVPRIRLGTTFSRDCAKALNETVGLFVKCLWNFLPCLELVIIIKKPA